MNKNAKKLRVINVARKNKQNKIKAHKVSGETNKVRKKETKVIEYECVFVCVCVCVCKRKEIERDRRGTYRSLD